MRTTEERVRLIREKAASLIGQSDALGCIVMGILAFLLGMCMAVAFV